MGIRPSNAEVLEDAWAVEANQMNQGAQLSPVGLRHVDIRTKGIHHDTNSLVPLPRTDDGLRFALMQP
jgi:hypothetical protein